MQRLTILLCLIVIGGPVAAGEIKVGVFVHQPIVFQDPETDAASGPGVDYVQAVIREMGHTAKISVLPISRILLYLKTGAIDMSLELAKNADRADFLHYSDLPVLTLRPALALRREHPLERIDTIDDLKGMSIGYLLGAFPGSFFTPSDAVRFEWVSGKDWLQQNLAKLTMGRIDAVLDQNPYACIAEAIRLGIEEKIKVLPLPVEGIRCYAVFSKKSPDAAAWLEAFNTINKKAVYNENKMIENYLNKLGR